MEEILSVAFQSSWLDKGGGSSDKLEDLEDKGGGRPDELEDGSDPPAVHFPDNPANSHIAVCL